MVGVIVVAAIVVFMVMRGSGTTSTDTTAGGNTISVSDQDPNSVAVVIDSATLSVPGFIVIHEDTNGAPGVTIAESSALTAGTYANKSVIVTMKPGATYWAMLHSDDGNGIYNAANDLPIKDASGMPVMAKFKVKTASNLNGSPDVKG